MSPDDVIFSDSGESDRDRWERENAEAMARATNKGKRFRKQKKATKKERAEAKARGASVINMVEKLKRTGLQGLKNRPSPP